MKILKSKSISMRIDERALKRFQEMYPNLLSTFIRKCVYNSVNNRQFFDDIFFNIKDHYCEVK